MAESLFYFIVMALSPLLICKVGAKRLLCIEDDHRSVGDELSRGWSSSWASCRGRYRSLSSVRLSSQLVTALHVSPYLVTLVHSRYEALRKWRGTFLATVDFLQELRRTFGAPCLTCTASGLPGAPEFVLIPPWCLLTQNHPSVLQPLPDR